MHSANWQLFISCTMVLCCMTVQVLQNYPCMQCPSRYGTAWFKDVMVKVHNCVYVPISSLQFHACPCRHISFWFQLTCPRLPIMHCWGVRLGFGLEQDQKKILLTLHTKCHGIPPLLLLSSHIYNKCSQYSFMWSLMCTYIVTHTTVSIWFAQIMT